LYRTTGISIGATLALAYGISSAGLIAPAAVGTVFIGSFIVSLGSIFAMYKIRPATYSTNGQLVTVNPPSRQAAFGTFVVANSVLVAPLVGMAGAISPFIVPAATVSALGVMFGASAYAYNKKSGALASWQGPAFGALLTLVGMQLAAIGAYAIIGPNMLSATMMTATP
jgi:FtsH-binding integral membrane protein